MRHFLLSLGMFSFCGMLILTAGPVSTKRRSQTIGPTGDCSSLVFIVAGDRGTVVEGLDPSMVVLREVSLLPILG